MLLIIIIIIIIVIMIIIIIIIVIMNSIGSVANPKWQNTIVCNDIKITPPYTTLKPTERPLYQYITAQQIQLISFYGPVVGLWLTKKAIT